MLLTLSLQGAAHGSFPGCLCFQVVYKEVERRPAVGAEDLSLQTISDGSALFNTRSKCMPSFTLIETIAFPVSAFPSSS